MNVIIFNSLLLPASQTFIRAQGEKLQKFTAYYVGSRLVPGLELPRDRTLVVNRGNTTGKLQEAWFKFTGSAPRIYQKIQNLHPKLIHAQFGLSGVLVLPWLRSLQIPLIVHYRGADATLTAASSRFTSLNHWLYFQRREALKQQTTLFLTVSKFIKTKLEAQGFPSDKIHPHYHGVDISQFQPQFHIQREPILLFVGRLTEKKGCEYLIRATAKIQTQCPDVRLVIIGDGPLRKPLESLAHKTLHRYEFLGMQPQETVKQWMNRAQILVTPSVTSSIGDSEGLPNVVLEAQAMKLPVVATVHAGIPEGVIHGKTGFLTAERNIEGLAKYSLQLLQNPYLWQQFSQQGRQHVETNFDRDKQTRILEEIYQSVVKEKCLV
jgi:glycosyltransferase involved in cell wall biosynthesis